VSDFFYLAADTVPLWSGPAVMVLAVLLIFILLFVWDANKDD
jgi:hypothetical protein